MHLAAASVLLSNTILAREPIWSTRLTNLTGKTLEMLWPCVESLREIWANAGSNQLKAVRRKYLFCEQRLGRPVAEQDVERTFGVTAGQSSDGLPLVGPLPGSARIVSCCGFNLRGLSLGVTLGDAIATLILEGQRTFPKSFLPGRFL